MEFERKHFHPSFVILLLQLGNICAACSTSKTLKNPLGQASFITQIQKDTMHQRIWWICIFHIICRIHCKWRNIKTLRTRTAIFLYHKTCKSSWDNRTVQNQPPRPMYMCVCSSSTLLFTKFLAKADRQHLVWSSLPYFKQKICSILQSVSSHYWNHFYDLQMTD